MAPQILSRLHDKLRKKFSCRSHPPGPNSSEFYRVPTSPYTPPARPYPPRFAHSTSALPSPLARNPPHEYSRQPPLARNPHNPYGLVRRNAISGADSYREYRTVAEVNRGVAVVETMDLGDVAELECLEDLICRLANMEEYFSTHGSEGSGETRASLKSLSSTTGTETTLQSASSGSPPRTPTSSRPSEESPSKAMSKSYTL